jgi:hypothetical protein
MSKSTYPGDCNLCGQTFNKAAMTNHMKACLRKHQKDNKSNKKQKTFVLSVDGDWRPEYWMYLEVPASDTLEKLDQFLRDTWLECCGHLSAFTIGQVRYEMDTHMVDAMWKDFFGPSMATKSMSARLYSVLKPGLKFHHEYDFGTTTDLRFKVILESERFEQSKEINILAQNHLPDIPCEICGKPATLVCGSCMYMGEGWLCKRCGKKHRCGEDMLLPVVNSPRVGMCGYTGEPGW